MDEHIKEFTEYTTKVGDRKELYSMVAKKFGIMRALYPGSHIDISPSLVIPEVIYIDSFKGAIKFFEKIELIQDYINNNKEYQEDCSIVFYGNNYEENLNMKKVDLIISQYAGFVGQTTKMYLKEDGILLCNDSHGDATLAFFDDDFEFIGVIDSNNIIITSELEKYFKFARERNVDIKKVYKTMKGPKYKYQAKNYLFKRKA
jgi:hypothetical protein